MYMYIISMWDFAYFKIRMPCAFVSWLTKRVKTTFLLFNYSWNLIWLTFSWNWFFFEDWQVCLLSLWFEWHQKWKLTVFFLKNKMNCKKILLKQLHTVCHVYLKRVHTVVKRKYISWEIFFLSRRLCTPTCLISNGMWSRDGIFDILERSLIVLNC